jgi:hypothetical protein
VESARPAITGEPQDRQNLEPSGHSVAQAGQAIMPEIPAD